VLAYYPAEALTIAGEATGYARTADSGAGFESFFCARCGSSVYARSAKHPAMIGVAVGAFADPDYPPPVRSVWEQTMHPWVGMPDGVQQFPQGRT
jgi:hypothetical protein